MPLLQLALRLPKADHAAIHDVAKARNKAAGNVVGDILMNASPDSVVAAIMARLQKNKAAPICDKKTLALVPEKALTNLSYLSEVSGLPKEYLVRTLIEAYVGNSKDD